MPFGNSLHDDVHVEPYSATTWLNKYPVAFVKQLVMYLQS
uniref:Uncharacterized protein n=1 Tax=Anguilla anguilla TaxID=7936 RepID=A0A0E9X9C6_ANGAN